MTDPLEPYLNYWRRRRELARRRQQRCLAMAWLDLEKITQVLVSQFGAQRVIVFGSLVLGRFREDSDIDVAVAGVPASDFFPALAAVQRLTAFPVDLKPWEDLEPYFQQKIIKTGEVLYERTDGGSLAGSGR